MSSPFQKFFSSKSPLLQITTKESLTEDLKQKPEPEVPRKESRSYDAKTGKFRLTGRTQEEQNKLNMKSDEKKKRNPEIYSKYMAARSAKREWEKNNSIFGDAKYPEQSKLDALKKDYKTSK